MKAAEIFVLMRGTEIARQVNTVGNLISNVWTTYYKENLQTPRSSRALARFAKEIYESR